MNDVFNLVATHDASNSKYLAIGLPRNPFLAQDTEGKVGPFYVGHLNQEIKEIGSWLSRALTGFVSPISIKGSIGVGKTRLLHQVQLQINQVSESQRVFAGYARIDKTGYSRPSVGQMLLESLEEVRISDEMRGAPDGVIPVLWAAAKSEKSLAGTSKMSQVLTRLQKANEAEVEERARLIGRWLHRENLSASQAERVGLFGKLDYEGQLPEILADLIRCLRDLDVLRQFYFMVDQLEDVFRPSYSELRRSRMLTDLRTLIDEIDHQSPIALILAWSPEVDDPRGYTLSRTDANLSREYPALYSRLIRHMIELNKLDQFNATGFAGEYLKHVNKLQGYDEEKAPKALDLASDAWKRLVQERKAVDNRATARDLLTALREVVDERASFAEQTASHS